MQHTWLALILVGLYGCGASAPAAPEAADEFAQSILRFTASYVVPSTPRPSGNKIFIDYRSVSGDVLISQDSSLESQLISCSSDRKKQIDSALNSLVFDDLSDIYSYGGPATLSDGIPMTFEFYCSNTNRTVVVDTNLLDSLPSALGFLYSVSLRRDFE